MTEPTQPSLVNWRALVAEATQRLRRVVNDPAIDAGRIAERASGYDASTLSVELDRPVTQREVAYFDRMVARRLTGEPLQYVLGSWSFRTLDLFLDARVLIPRPETEVVTGVALAELDRTMAARGAARARAVDLGTGSGAIALAIAVERAAADLWATDISGDALDVARANLAAIGHPGRRVVLLEGDWFSALPAELRNSVDVVVSNPPYVAANESLPAAVRDWEPAGALVAGPTGLEAHGRIVAEAREWLMPSGALVLEIGESQAAAVTALVKQAGFAEVAVHRDLAGRDRVVVAR